MPVNQEAIAGPLFEYTQLLWHGILISLNLYLFLVIHNNFTMSCYPNSALSSVMIPLCPNSFGCLWIREAIAGPLFEYTQLLWHGILISLNLYLFLVIHNNFTMSCYPNSALSSVMIPLCPNSFGCLWIREAIAGPLFEYTQLLWHGILISLNLYLFLVIHNNFTMSCYPNSALSSVMIPLCPNSFGCLWIKKLLLVLCLNTPSYYGMVS